MRRVKRLGVMSLVALTVMSGCRKKETDAAFCVGVIDTVQYGEGKTFCYCYDDTLTQNGSIACKYSGVGNYGDTPVQVLDHTAYVMSVGNLAAYDDCAVLAMDMQTQKWEKYSFQEHPGMHDFRVTRDGIYAISNMNQVTYVDFYSFATKKKKSVTVQNVTGVFMSVRDNRVYFLSEDFGEEQMHTYLYCVDLEKQNYQKCLDVTDTLEENLLVYTQWVADKMYIPNGDTLVIYDPKKNQLKQVELPGMNTYQILLDQEDMYLVDCNMHELSATTVYRYDWKNGMISDSYRFEEPILQSVVRDGSFYALQQQPKPVIRKYELLEDGNWNKMEETAVSEQKDNKHIISDLFMY